jgi:hypothetical protein
MTDQDQSSVDPLAAAQGEFAADPATQTGADPAAAPDPFAEAAAAAAQEDPDAVAADMNEDDTVAPEIETGGTRHAKYGIQTAPADHPRTSRHYALNA